MKLNWKEIIELIIWLFKVVKQIIKADAYVMSNKYKHSYVKERIMPYIKNKGWSFTGDDVDKIINGLVWFIKKVWESNKKS
jgi:hypothetical protein